MVQAYCTLPAGTGVTFAVSADGKANWTTIMREYADSGGDAYGEYNTNAAQPDAWTLPATWSQPGSISQYKPQLPSSNIAFLWANVAPGTNVEWQATLVTTNTAVTPKIQNPSPGAGNYAVEIYAESTPPVPIVTPPQGMYLTTIPQFTWTNADGFNQSDYEVLINRQPGNSGGPQNWDWDSGVQQGPATSMTVPEGVLWNRGNTSSLCRCKCLIVGVFHPDIQQRNHLACRE